MTVCRTIDEVRAAADADSRDDPALSQEQADFIAAILAPHRTMLARVRSEQDADSAERR
jgi:hypothetical protein